MLHHPLIIKIPLKSGQRRLIFWLGYRHWTVGFIDLFVSKAREHNGAQTGGKPFSRGGLYDLLKNPLYIGKVAHQGKRYEGQHAAILDNSLWQAAQARLKVNKNNHDFRKSVKNPSLLAGLLFDDYSNVWAPNTQENTTSATGTMSLKRYCNTGNRMRVRFCAYLQKPSKGCSSNGSNNFGKRPMNY